MTSYEDFNKQRIQNAVIDSSEGRKALIKELKSRVNKKRKELADLKFKRYSKKIDKITSKVEKALTGKLKNKQVMKETNRVGVDVSQPVYTKDKSRFFKTAWEEEKKQLYFK